MNNASIEELANAFCNQIGIHTFDRDKWFVRAYSTMQRTKKGSISPDQKRNIKELLFEEISNTLTSVTSQEEFDEWILKITDKIGDFGDLTFGQSQKIVNILLKYYYCYFYSKQDAAFNKTVESLQPVFNFFHAPVDNVMMVALKRDYNSDKLNFVKKVANSARFVENGNLLAWSRLPSEDPYRRLQEIVQELSAAHNFENKMHFEMANLWKAADETTKITSS